MCRYRQIAAAVVFTVISLYASISMHDPLAHELGALSTIELSSHRPPHTMRLISRCPFVEHKILIPPQAAAQETNGSVPITYGRLGSLVNSNETFEVFNIDGNQTLIDLACLHQFSHAFYHRLIDCFAPAICALHYAVMEHPDQAVLVPDNLLEIFDFFSDPSTNRTVLPYKYTNTKAYGLNISSNGKIDLISPSFNATDYDRQPALASMRKWIRARYPGAPKAEHIVIINRSCSRSRCFPDVSTIYKQFTGGLRMPAVFYNGNESFKETVNIFTRARVVVGYHGVANAIFCQDETVVLEYTTFHNINATRMWRTNERVAAVHGGLVWLKHGIDVDRLTDFETLQTQKMTDTDHFIKDLKRAIDRGGCI